MSNAGCRRLLPSNYCKHMYFVVSPAFLSCFSPHRPNSRSSARHRPRLARPRASDHDRDDGVAESPYMLIQGFARLTNRKNRSRAWRLGKSNRRRSPVLFSTRTRALGRELIWLISAHLMRARHKTRKGRPGIDRLGKLIDFLLTRMPRASATKACISYIMRSKRNKLSNGFVRTNSSATTGAR